MSPNEQLNIAAEGVTEIAGVGATSLSARQVPDPFEPVLVYAPESVFQSLLALPVKAYNYSKGQILNWGRKKGFAPW